MGDLTNLAAGADRTRLEAEVARKNVRWEIRNNWIMAILILLACGMITAISPWIGAKLAVRELVLSVIAVAYFALCSLLLVRGGAAALPGTRWLNTTMEASFSATAILVALLVKGPAWAMTSPLGLLAPLALVASLVRIRPELTLYATAVACVEWLAVYYLAIHPRLSAETLAALPTLQPWAAWERAFWIALVGGLAAFACAKGRTADTSLRMQAWQRRWLEREFGKFVSRDVLDAVLRGEARFGHAERRRVTVLFCDLRDFTSLCEHERPEVVLTLLNTFFERACVIIQAHGGHVNKFLGDGVLAFFGAPDPHPRHAHAAADAAQQLLVAADELRAQGGVWDRLRIGIGLDTGDVVAGTVGAPDRLEYSAIGSTVNRAARLQALAASRGRRIVVSDACAQALGPRIDLEAMDEVVIKGFDGPTRIHGMRTRERAA